MNSRKLNIAVIGKTGVGKSSLINYLFNQPELAETGSGKPVTKPGFHEYQKNISKINYKIFDSFGLEPGKTKKWISDFEEFIGPKQNSKNIREWLHSCIYCISGASARIEPFELKVIKILKEKELNPVIVITKADSSSANELSKYIEKELKVNPVSVTSIKKETFSKKIELQGREQLFDKLIENSLASFKKRVEYMLKQYQTDRLKFTFESNYNYLKDFLVLEKGMLDNVSKQKIDFIKTHFDKSLKKDIEITNFKIQEKKRDALSFYKKELQFSLINFETSDKINYNLYDEKLNIGITVLMYTVGLPLTFPFALGLLIEELFVKKQSIIKVLKGVKSQILGLDVVKKDNELTQYLDRSLDTNL